MADIPQINSTIEIKSMKHTDKLHRRWKENTVLFTGEDIIIGGNDRTIVEESDGKTWRTEEPAIFYFDRRFWFNIIMLMTEDSFYYYCNLSSPFTYSDNTISYIDYDIDVIVDADYSYRVVDREEFEENKRKLHYPPHVEHSVAEGLTELKKWIRKQEDPFNKTFLTYWYHAFLHKRKK